MTGQESLDRYGRGRGRPPNLMGCVVIIAGTIGFIPFPQFLHFPPTSWLSSCSMKMIIRARALISIL